MHHFFESLVNKAQHSINDNIMFYILFCKGVEKMCELFGRSGKTDEDVTDVLKNFYSHCKNHPHGWGLACWNNDNHSKVFKNSVKADDDPNLQSILENKVDAKTVLAHIRYATIGSISVNNSHPFTKRDILGRDWTLIHNGTIFSGMKLIGYSKKQLGQTDSERVFLYLIDEINKTVVQKERDLLQSERIKVVDTVVRDIAPRNKLNLIIYDGDIMYVHTNMKNTLYMLNKEDNYLFATVPLTNDIGWQNVPMTRLLAYQNGRQIYKGDSHNYEYIMCQPGEVIDYIL